MKLDALENGSIVRDCNGLLWRQKGYMWFPMLSGIEMPYQTCRSSYALSLNAPIHTVCAVSFNRSSGAITRIYDDGRVIVK
jgi:hypothetical protein